MTLGTFLVVCAWFNPFQFSVFAGDDLRTFGSDHGNFAESVRFWAFYYKFRPVTWAVFLEIAKWTNCDFQKIASIGMAIHTANALIFFSYLSRTLRLPLYLSIGATLVATLNRFACYVFSQDSAITEGLAITVLLLILISASRFLARPTLAQSLLLTLFFALIIHIHERYLVLALPLIYLSVIRFNLHRIGSALLGSGVMIGAITNFCLKKLWLKTPVLVGTQTQKIDFNLGQISSFMWSGFLNVIGINRGPTHLSLQDFPDSPWWIQVISSAAGLLSIALVAGIVLGVIRRLRGQETRWAAGTSLGYYALMIGSLLLSASITFRQEFRWVYPAFIVFLAALAYGVVELNASGKGWLYVSFSGLLLLSISREVYLARLHPRFFAFQVSEVASSLFRTLHDVGNLAQYDAVLIRGEVPAKDWTFLDGTFSRFYRLPALEFAYQNAAVEQTDESRLVVDYSGNDRSFTIARAKQLPIDHFDRMNYSALKQPAAAFRPNDRWSTPTKTPIFPMSKNGVDCMFAVAPVNIVVPVPRAAAVLHTCFSHVYALGDGTDVEITAITPAGTKLLLSRVVPRLTDNDFPVWRKYEFALPPDTQQIDFHVYSKTDQMGDWLAIRDFSFD